MRYFKNTELAKLYNISEKSVRNWIQSAEDGKLDLELFYNNDRPHIANTSKNTHLIEELAQKGKKYKNTRSYKVVSPGADFYKLYTEKQILEIISNLTIHHEVPTQYSYVDGGAKFWDQYANRLSEEQTSNILTATNNLLDANSVTIDHLLADHNKINVIDLGPGNGLPIRQTLSRLLEQNMLGRYIAIDGSRDMLRILESNIEKWFEGKVAFEGYVRDFSYERFDDLLANDYLGDSDNIPANLVVLLGGTLSNFRSPNQALQTINSSLGLDDLLVYSGYLDTPSTRRYFDFAANSRSNSNQKLRSELILGFLGIDESLYSIEQMFDEEKHARSGSFKLKVDLTIKFELSNGVRYVELRKNEPFLLWRHWHKNAIDIFKQLDENGFDLMQATKSKDREYLLILSKIKTSF